MAVRFFCTCPINLSYLSSLVFQILMTYQWPRSSYPLWMSGGCSNESSGGNEVNECRAEYGTLLCASPQLKTPCPRGDFRHSVKFSSHPPPLPQTLFSCAFFTHFTSSLLWTLALTKFLRFRSEGADSLPLAAIKVRFSG